MFHKDHQREDPTCKKVKRDADGSKDPVTPNRHVSLNPIDSCLKGQNKVDPNKRR